MNVAQSLAEATVAVNIHSADLQVTPTHRLSDFQSKMLEYQRLGVKLGLLINPQDKQVEIYRSNEEVEVLQDPGSFAGSVPEVIDCQDVMPGFNLDLTKILRSV